VRRIAALLVMVAGLAVALGQPETALGHAALRTSDPAANAFLQRAPGQISLAFTEPIDPKSSFIEVLDAGGNPIELGALSVSGPNMTVPLPQLQPGIYNVLWGNVSRIDGHAIRGSFPFTVLNPDGSVPAQTNTVGGFGSSSDPAPLADGIAVRALSLLGLLLVAGGALITLLAAAPEERVRRGLTMAVYAGAGVLFVATLLNFFTIREAYSGVPIRDLVFNTPSGGYWLTRVGLVFLIAVANSFALEAPRRTAAALAGCVVVYLWAFTATSHAAAVGAGSAWARAFDVVHGTAAVAWIGAVVGLAIAARLGRGASGWHLVIPRFSLLASAAVFVLLTSGVLNAFIQVDTVSKLWETRYGVVLLVKLGIMFPLLGVAAYNATRGKHRLASRSPDERRRFLWFTTAEVALGVGVFLMAAWLTQTTASRSIIVAPDSRPFDQQGEFGDLAIQLQVDPNQTGVNTYRVALTDASGSPVEAQRVRLTFRYQEDQSLGPSSLTLAPGSEPGSFSGQGPFMTLEGRWRIETEVRRADADDVIGFFDVRPAGTAVIPAATSGAFANPAPGLTWNQFGGFVFLFAGLGFALARTPLRRVGKEAGWAANGVTMAGFAFGVLLLFGVHGHEETGDNLVNPVYPDANSINTGRTLFQQNCAVCHGRNGVPPQGLDLNPYPLDLTVHVPQHSDSQIFRFIDQGLPGTAMRAWGEDEGSLTEEQIWHLVNFLRTLSPVDR
jgi:copper transport protein